MRFVLPIPAASLAHRLTGGRVGRRAYVPLSHGVSPRAVLHRPERIAVHPSALVGDFVVIQPGEGVTLGAGTQVNYFTVVLGGPGVTLGENVLVGPHCVLAAGNHDFRQTDRPMRFAGSITRGPIVVGDHAWLGAHVTVTDGVTIGREAVIGAGSVVTRDVPDWAIAVGSPARVIGDRREPDRSPADAAAARAA